MNRSKNARRQFPEGPGAGRSTPGRGFTLVEILVTIAIVLILAAIGVVGLHKAKQSARQAKAMGPLREVAAANLSFSMDNQGHINTLRWQGDPEEGMPWVENSFWGRMERYIDPESAEGGGQKALQEKLRRQLAALFSSGDVGKMRGTLLQGSKIYHDASGLPVPFAFNDYLYTWKEWENMGSIDSPSEIAYITYGFGIFDEKDASSYAERPLDGSKPKNNIYYLPNRKAMVAFLDGHVEVLGPPMHERRLRWDYYTRD